jgi:chloride channel protein, CIC family
MRLSRPSREALFLLFAILVGSLSGIGALAFMGLIALGQGTFWPAGDNFLIQVSLAPWWLRILIPVLGGLTLGPIIAFWVPELRGPGVSGVIEAAALEDSQIPPKVTILKSLCTALAISTGGSLGREGPVATIGAAIGSGLGRFFHLGTEKIRVALACGAAGGIAATFNAPFAGTLFAIEILLSDVNVAYLGPVALAAIFALVAARNLWSGFPLLTSPPFTFNNPWEIGLYLVLGLVGGFVSLLFIRCVSAADNGLGKLSLPLWSRPALGGLALGLVGLWSPEVFGVGYTSINMALAGELSLQAASLTLLAKFLAAAICLATMSGGVFGPSLFLGSMLGTAFALGLNFLIPGLQLNPVDYALVGMGTVVSGTTLAPMTAILIIFELTKSYHIIIPLFLSCVGSLLIVKFLYGYSAYDTKLLRRGVHLVRGLEVNVLRSLRVKDCMNSQMELIYDDTIFGEIIRKAEESPFPDFVVVDQQGNLNGVVTLSDLRRGLQIVGKHPGALKAEELKTRNVITVSPEDDLETALDLLERDLPFLPVVPPATKAVVGVLRTDDVLTAYHHKLLKLRLHRFS